MKFDGNNISTVYTVTCFNLENMTTRQLIELEERIKAEKHKRTAREFTNRLTNLLDDMKKAGFELAYHDDPHTTIIADSWPVSEGILEVVERC